MPNKIKIILIIFFCAYISNTIKTCSNFVRIRKIYSVVNHNTENVEKLRLINEYKELIREQND